VDEQVVALLDGGRERRLHRLDRDFLVRLGDDRVGIGEATPLPGWTESMAACREALEGEVEAAEANDSEAGLPPMASTPAARHGLELALLDRSARAAGLPLYRHLGGDRRVSAVRANATIGDGDVEQTVTDCRAAVAEGFRSLKVKVGARPVDDDTDRLAAVREAVGDHVELRVDANGAWSGEEAATAVEALAELGVSLVEQPLDRGDLAGHARLRDRGVAIALDESLCEHGIETVLDADAADGLVLKPMVLGGVGRAKEVAERARSAGLEVVVTTTVDAVVARTAAVHLAAALDVDRACGLATADWLARDVGSDPAAVVDGTVSVPQGAGHGVGVEALE
jgi:o-succinylbenzoate synthase